MITNIQKHRGHPKAVVVLKTEPNQPKQHQHYGKLVCRLCDRAFVRWASKEETDQAVYKLALKNFQTVLKDPDGCVTLNTAQNCKEAAERGITL